MWRCRTKGERRRCIKERSCGLGKHEGTVLREELMQTQVRCTQRQMRRQCRGGDERVWKVGEGDGEGTVEGDAEGSSGEDEDVCVRDRCWEWLGRLW